MRAGLLACLLCLAAAPAARAQFTARHIFVDNRGGGNIVELADDLTLVRTWFDTAGLNQPNGMAFTPDGRLFVADTNNNRILAFDATGARVGTAIDTTTTLGGSVESIYFDATGLLYATANPGLGRVVTMHDDGTMLHNLVDAPVFLNLGNVNLTVGGNVVVSDFSAAGRGLRELDASTGAVLHTFGATAGEHNEDVAIDGADRVFATSWLSNTVIVYAADRTEARRLTAPGLTEPTGIVITHDCRVIVTSFATNELYEFQHDGTFLRHVSIAGLTSPESMAIAGQGLPGSFSEFAERVPTCDPAVDGGVSDAGAGVPDAGGDSGASRDGEADAAADDGGASHHVPSSGGCCEAAGTTSGGRGAPCVVVIGAGALAVLRRRSRR